MYWGLYKHLLADWRTHSPFFFPLSQCSYFPFFKLPVYDLATGAQLVAKERMVTKKQSPTYFFHCGKTMTFAVLLNKEAGWDFTRGRFLLFIGPDFHGLLFSKVTWHPFPETVAVTALIISPVFLSVLIAVWCGVAMTTDWLASNSQTRKHAAIKNYKWCLIVCCQ